MRKALLTFPNGETETVDLIERDAINRSVTGYGAKMPIGYGIERNGRFRRVYVCNYGNAGSAFIGRSLADRVALVEFA